MRSNIQQQIDALPREHSPMPYRVALYDRRGNTLRTLYVRASSQDRANLTALRECNPKIQADVKSMSASQMRSDK